MNGHARGHTRSRATIAICVAVATVTAGAAMAEMTRWHPYFVAFNKNVIGRGHPWTTDYLTKIDSGADNVVWNKDNVYYDAPTYDESWYDVIHPDSADLQEGQRLIIHNPTVTNYTGDDKILITLYDRVTGNQMLDTDPEINTSPGHPDVSFNTSTDVWEVELGSMETIVITDSDFMDNGKGDIFVMKIHCPKDGGGDGAFFAQTDRFNQTRWRVDSGTADSDFKASPLSNRAFRSYSLQAAEDLDGLTSAMLILPHWVDKSTGVEKYTSYVHIANVDSVDLDITVEVFKLDGTSHKSHTFDDVPAHSLVTMIPSQFLDSGDPEEGYLQASAVQSADTEEVGEILGVNHELLLSVVHFIPGAGYARSLRGEALTIIDDN
jgi:hypothetical protein